MKRIILVLIFFSGPLYAADPGYSGLSKSTVDGLDLETIHSEHSELDENAVTQETEKQLQDHKSLVAYLDTSLAAVERRREERKAQEYVQNYLLHCAQENEKPVSADWKPAISLSAITVIENRTSGKIVAPLPTQAELREGTFTQFAKPLSVSDLCRNAINPFREEASEDTLVEPRRNGRRWKNLAVTQKNKVILPYDAVDEVSPTAQMGYFLVRSGDRICKIQVDEAAAREEQFFICPGARTLTELSNGDFAVLTQIKDRASLLYINTANNKRYRVILGNWPCATNAVHLKEVQPGLLSVAYIRSDVLLNMILLNFTNATMSEIESCGELYREVFSLNPSWVGILQGNNHLTLYNRQTQEKKMLDIPRLYPNHKIFLCPQYCDERTRPILALYRMVDKEGSRYYGLEHFYITDEGHKHSANFYKMSDIRVTENVQYERDCAIIYSIEKEGSDLIKGLMIDQHSRTKGEYQFRTTCSERPKVRKRNEGDFVISRLEKCDPETQKPALLYMLMRTPDDSQNKFFKCLRG